MAINLEKTFEVASPLEEVWGFLTDPERVAGCFPATKLTGSIGERAFRGEVALKLGPVGARFRGVVRFEEVDVERRHVVMTGKGQDRWGMGNVRMKMASALVPREGGGTRVWISQSLVLTGKLALLGRGVIGSLADAVLGRFTRCVQRKLLSQEERSGRGGTPKAPGSLGAPAPSGPPVRESLRSAEPANDARATGK